MNVERLQFADVKVDLVQGRDQAPLGSALIADTTAAGAFNVGDLLNVSIGTLTDADNPGGTITGPIRYTWQASTGRGTSAFFQDIVLLPGGDLAFESANGTQFAITPDLAGLNVRVKVMYTDAHDVTEIAYSDAVTVSDVAPPAPVVITPPTPQPVTTDGGPGVHLVRSDLDFILDQIKISEAHAAGTPLTDLIPNIRLAYGLRTVDGSAHNLL